MINQDGEGGSFDNFFFIWSLLFVLEFFISYLVLYWKICYNRFIDDEAGTMYEFIQKFENILIINFKQLNCTNYTNVNRSFTLVRLLGNWNEKEEFGRRRRKGLLAEKNVCMYDCAQVTHFNIIHLKL